MIMGVGMKNSEIHHIFYWPVIFRLLFISFYAIMLHISTFCEDFSEPKATPTKFQQPVNCLSSFVSKTRIIDPFQAGFTTPTFRARKRFDDRKIERNISCHAVKLEYNGYFLWWNRQFISRVAKPGQYLGDQIMTLLIHRNEMNLFSLYCNQVL